MTEALAPLIRRLFDPECYPHPVDRIELVETHISWVLLTGRYAYKIKKPVNLGFLDFSTLELRRYYCVEELRINRRFAPQLYLDVVSIGGTMDAPRIGAGGTALEHAVRMAQFSPDAQLDRVIRRRQLRVEHIDALAVELARCHQLAAVAEVDSPFGLPDAIRRPVETNLAIVAAHLDDPIEQRQLAELRQWTAAEHARLTPTLGQRKAAGRIRECHGDLHCGNLVLLNDRVTLFDAIEFSPELRWIDVMSDLAFIVMDLLDHSLPHFAARLLNRYLQETGDYAGLAVLPYYLVYRAIVRAMVALVRADQTGSVDEVAAARRESHKYRSLAYRLAERRQAGLVLTYGLSGAGKSHLTGELLEILPAVRIRSDVERKRILDRAPVAVTAPEEQSEVYGSAATKATYDRLVELARQILVSGQSAIVDATLLCRWQRQAFWDLAQEIAVPAVVLNFQVPIEVLRRRITERQARQQDPSEATLDVLAGQLALSEPLGADEAGFAIVVDGENVAPASKYADEIRRRWTAAKS